MPKGFEFPGVVEVLLLTVNDTTGEKRMVKICPPMGTLPNREEIVDTIRTGQEAIGAEGFRIASPEEFQQHLLEEIRNRNLKKDNPPNC